ncbi:hypothetical protein FHG87_018271, partial [Trinorchestia longiramus]
MIRKKVPLSPILVLVPQPGHVRSQCPYHLVLQPKIIPNMRETTKTTVTNGSAAIKTLSPDSSNNSLDLWSLKTVTWLETNPALRDGYTIAKTQTDKVRQYRIVEVVFTIVLFQLSLVDTVVRTVPWPAWFVNLVHKLDDVLERYLEYAFRTLEWWFDCISIRLMRLLETLVVYLDNLITAIDSAINYLIQTCRWVIAAVNKVYERVLAVWSWYVSLWVSLWASLKSGVQSTQQMWALSQE